MNSWSEKMNPPPEEMSFYIDWLNRVQGGLGSLQCSPETLPPPSYGRSLTLYSSLWTILVLHLLVIHAYTSACLISHSFWRSVSCGDPDSTVQELCPHKCGQDVSCGHLMRRWQLSPGIAPPPCSYGWPTILVIFCLGGSRRLSLRACRSFLLWPRFAEDRIVFSNVSWQIRPSSFILGHFFLLSVGLGVDMKWAGVAKFFGPTITPQNPAIRLLGREGGFWCPRAYVMAGRVLSSVSARASSPA